MHPASKMRQAMVRGDAVVDLIPVAHERGAAPDAGIELLGVHGAAPRRIGEQPHRWTSAIHLRPHVALRLGLAPGLLEHLDRGLVAVDQVRVQQVVAQQVDHRLYSLADAHDAGSQRIARDVATEAA
ncbi:hypothetical protein FQZ97_935600 [compost metagenome]